MLNFTEQDIKNLNKSDLTLEKVFKQFEDVEGVSSFYEQIEMVVNIGLFSLVTLPLIVLAIWWLLKNKKGFTIRFIAMTVVMSLFIFVFYGNAKKIEHYYKVGYLKEYQTELSEEMVKGAKVDEQLNLVMIPPQRIKEVEETEYAPDVLEALTGMSEDTQPIRSFITFEDSDHAYTSTYLTKEKMKDEEITHVTLHLAYDSKKREYRPSILTFSNEAGGVIHTEYLIPKETFYGTK